MDKWLGKTGVLLFVLAFGVFYGIDTANRGIERVHGPLPDSAVSSAEQRAEPAAAEELGVVMDHRERMNALREQGDEQAAAPPPEVSLSPFSKILSWIGSALHALADRLIRLVVELGESLLT